MWLTVLLAGCFLRNEYPEPNCPDRLAYYPDEDGNGLGEPSAMYVGCAPPEGWVAKLDPVFFGGGDTADTGG